VPAVKLEPGQEILLTGAEGADTFMFETVVRSVSTFALEVDPPGSDDESVTCSEGMHFLVIVQDGEGGHYFFDTFCVGVNLSGKKSLTLLFPSEFLKLPVRQSLRAIVNVPVEIVQAGRGDHKSFKTQSINLSAGGVFVTSPHRLEEGSRVTMKLHLPGQKKTLAVLARLKRSQESEEKGGHLFLQAYEFADIREESRKRIEEYIKGSFVRFIPRNREKQDSGQ
jgi:c-di-GMP-binding flagellar brake protein YcgR